MKDLSGRTLAIVHASLISSKSVQPFVDEIIPEVTVVHHVDDTIQNTNFVCEPGVVPKANYFRFAAYAHFLEESGVDLILLACSTFNRAVELARPMINTPLLQIDRPMMDLAVRTGKRIGLLATLASTVPSSERLLKLAASEAGKEVEVKTVLCAAAFEQIRKGNVDKHNEILVKEMGTLSHDVDCIVMAQVSMSALEPMLRNTRVPVYNSGRTGFTRVREILESL
jgi:aspartate/glutamate racemase